MKKLFLCAILALIGVTAARAEYTILYLIPFESDSYVSPFVKNCEEVEAVRSYQLMGFWNGAQMALDDFTRAVGKQIGQNGFRHPGIIDAFVPGHIRHVSFK